MENALLIGLSRQTALAREFETVANNIANVNTNGFKRRASLFSEHLMPLAKANEFRRQDRDVSFVIDRGSWLSAESGAIEPTGQPLDIAIKGQGFFVMQGPNGQERYSRDGAFTVNAAGQLVNLAGKPVMTTQGPLSISPGETDLKISPDGSISSSAGPRGRLRIALFADVGQLKNEGASEFSGDGAREALAAEVSLETGAVERSNVKPVLEISRMIEISRAYASIAQMMQRTDDLRRNAVQRLGDTQT
jgi:flagellar basal-body rod protein FlgF